MAIIGIDLGTTNSLAAYWRDGRLPCLEVSTIIFRSRPTPKTLLKAWK